MARRIAAVAVVGIALAIRAFARFGETMAQVRGVAGATAKQFELLRKQSLDLGRTTRFSATEVAAGQLFLARAGFEVREIFAALPGTLRLAQAATIGVGQAADFVSNALAAFRESADQTTRFVDVMAKTTTSANTDMVQLADALKLVAPVATSLNVSIETTAAAIGVLSDAGLQATLAGTGLRKVMFDLQSPTKNASAILRSLGLTARDVSIEQNGLVEVLERLSKAGISATQVIEIFGARGAPAFLNLTAAIPRIKELNEELLNSAGTAEDLARVYDDTLGGAFRRLVSAVEGFGITLVSTSGLGAGLRRDIDGIAASINRLTDNLDNVLTALRDTVAVAGLFLAGRFITQTIAAVGALKGLGAAAIAGRIGLAALGGPGGWIAIVAASLGFFVLRLESAEKATTALGRSMERLVSGAESQQDTVRSLAHAVQRFEFNIAQIQRKLDNEPLTLSLRLNLRAFRGRLEEELRGLRERLAEAREVVVAARPAPPPPPAPSIGRAGRQARDIGVQIARDTEKRTRLALQQIELLETASTEQQRRLQAQFEVANRLVEEQERLTRALATAQGESRTRLLAEQAALNSSVKGIDDLVSAKEKQLRIEASLVAAGRAPQAQDAALARTLNFFRALEDAGRRRVEQIRQRIQLLGLEGDALARQGAQFEVINQINQRALELERALEGARLSLARALVVRNVEAIRAAEQQLRLAEQRVAVFDRQRAGLDELVAGYKEAAVAAGRLNAVAGLIRRELTPLQAYTEQLGLLSDALQTGIIRYDQFAVGLENIERQFKEAANQVSLTALLTDTLADGLANAAGHARSLSDALRSIGVTLASSLLRTFLPRLVGSLFGGAGAPGQGAIANLQGRQHGGPVGAGQSVVVGERGPEIFTARRPGTIIPNLQTAGAPSFQFVFQINSSDGPGVIRALAAARPVLISDAVEAARRVLTTDLSRKSPVRRAAD